LQLDGTIQGEPPPLATVSDFTSLAAAQCELGYLR